MSNIVVALLGVLTLVQISPLKINPWGWIGKQVKNVMVGDLEKKIDGLTDNFASLESLYQADKISSIRWRVLNFGNSCLQNRKHTKEEWEHCLSELAIYEQYCRKNKIPNGVMEEMSRFLRETYRERLEKKDFL